MAALVAGLRPWDPWAGSEGEEGSIRRGEGSSRAAVVASDVRRRGTWPWGLGSPLGRAEKVREEARGGRRSGREREMADSGGAEGNEGRDRGREWGFGSSLAA